MKVSMLTEKQAASTASRLARGCIRFDVAVAWAGANAVTTTLLAEHKKLRRVVIGTHMYQTDPSVLRAFMQYRGARCMAPSGRLFHPKVYLFLMPEGLTALVGSHNLTNGAFGGSNIEVSVLLEGTRNDEVFVRLEAFIRSNWMSAEEINEKFLFPYELQYEASRIKRRELKTFNWLKPPARPGASTTALTWDKFVAGVRGDLHHSLDGRLAILERAHGLFEEHGSFARMSPDARKAVAGTYGSREPRLDALPWPWFGTMFSQGHFKALVNDHPRFLSAALDHIPDNGDVSEQQFNAFRKDFDRAFRGKSKKGGVPAASRLLAMKRPDYFVAVTGANNVGICKFFETARTTLNLGNYWSRIVVPMQNSPWWLATRPRGLMGRIWDNRAALLDSIYYAPLTRRAAN